MESQSDTQHQEDCPSSGSRRRKTITAGGKTRNVSEHLGSNPHPGVTLPMTAYALDKWVGKGVWVDKDGRESTIYLGPVEGSDHLLRIAVSMDDKTVITSFIDSGATAAWRRGDMDYFNSKYRDFEVRT